MALLDSIGNRQYLPWCLEGLAGVAAQAQRWDLVGELCGARERLLDESGSSAAAICPDAFDDVMVAARSMLGETTFEAHVAQGRTLEPSDLIAEFTRTIGFPS